MILRLLTTVGVMLVPAMAQLINDRSVKCQSDSMDVSFQFAQPFNGVVYANKYYQSDECRWSGDGTSVLTVKVPLSVVSTNKPYCGVTVQEGTGEFSVMLVVTPMKGLLVDGMSGLQVRCTYNIGDVTLTLPAQGANGAGIFISPQTQAGVVTGSGGSPFLLMAIRDGHGINGDVVQAASVGQRITLDVVMQDTTIYDFYVHDCYAHDGSNTPDASISVIDGDGCAVRLSRAVDVPVFTTPPVSGGAKHVYVHMYGFQFTTSQLVYFECQVRPCLQNCNRPQCESQSQTTGVGAVRRRRQSAFNSIANQFARRQSLTSGAGSGFSNGSANSKEDDYRLQFKLFIDPQRSSNDNVIPARDDPLPQIDRSSVFEDRICINVQVGIAILIIFVLVCVVSLVLTAFLCYRAHTESPTKAGTIKNFATYYTPSSTPSAVSPGSGTSSAASTYNTQRQASEMIGH